MQVKEYEHVLETEEERLSVHIFGTDYQNGCAPDLREWVRGRVIINLWTKYATHRPVAAA